MNLVSTMLLGRVQERAASAIWRIECVDPELIIPVTGVLGTTYMVNRTYPIGFLFSSTLTWHSGPLRPCCLLKPRARALICKPLPEPQVFRILAMLSVSVGFRPLS